MSLESVPMSLPSVPPEEPAPQRSRVAERLLAQPLRNLGVGVTAIVLGTTAAFGGLEEAEGADAPTPVKVGTTTTAEPFDITIKRLLWVNDLPGYPTSADGNRWLAIVADVKNTGETTLLPTYAREAVTVSGVEGLPKPPELDLTTDQEDDRTNRIGPDHLLYLPDSTELSPLQPGISYEAVYLYEQEAAATPAEKVDVQLVGHTLRADTFQGTEQYLDPAVVAEASLAVLPSEDAADGEVGETTDGAAG
jgi:hypothetical protein